MEFVKVNGVDFEGFDAVWDIYESSFPSDEIRTLDLQKDLFKNDKYSFFAVFKDGVLVGLITEWDFDDFLFVEHLAVREDLRGKGIGTELLKIYLSGKNKRVVLESDRPCDSISIRRIRFYERVGFKLNLFDYIQPSYGEGKNPVPMFLMTFPDEISESDFFYIRDKLHRIVYGLDKPIV